MSIQPLNNGGPPPAYSPPAKSPHGVETSAPKDTSSAPHSSKLQVSQDNHDNPNQLVDQKESLRQATKRVNDLITGLSSDLKFTVDEETGINVVKVVDVKTKEVIRQIPAQEMLDIAKRLDELRGLLIKEQV